MKIIIAGATGFIGRELVKRWIDNDFDVMVIGRSKLKIKNLFNSKVTAITWEEIEEGDFDTQNIECIVNLSGAGIADKRWTNQRKDEILNSRISATKVVVEFCLRTKIPLFNASAIGIYGQQKIIKRKSPLALDEDTKISEGNSRNYLAHICHMWEEATKSLKNASIRTVNLRFGVVLAKDGGALSKMIMPFYFFMGGPLGCGYQTISWISLTDVCRGIDFIIENKSLNGPINLVAPQSVNQRELARALGSALRKPSFFTTPRFMLKLFLGQMAEEILLNGQNVYPKKLLENGFNFRHKTIQEALAEMFG